MIQGCVNHSRLSITTLLPSSNWQQFSLVDPINIRVTVYTSNAAHQVLLCYFKQLRYRLLYAEIITVSTSPNHTTTKLHATLL
jgi:hypothetical protein